MNEVALVPVIVASVLGGVLWYVLWPWAMKNNAGIEISRNTALLSAFLFGSTLGITFYIPTWKKVYFPGWMVALYGVALCSQLYYLLSHYYARKPIVRSQIISLFLLIGLLVFSLIRMWK